VRLSKEVVKISGEYGGIEPTVEPVPGKDVTEEIKAKARDLGFGEVGITRYDRRYTFKYKKRWIKFEHAICIAFEQDYERMGDKVMDEVKRFFRPEFLNRIDASVVFHALEQEHIVQIVDLMLKQVRQEVRDAELDMDATRAAKEKLAEEGYDPHLGARPLRRVIQSKVEDKLSEEILSGKYVPGDTVLIDVDEDGDIVTRLGLKAEEPTEPAEPTPAA
jgi:hypothetical protein